MEDPERARERAYITATHNRNYWIHKYNNTDPENNELIQLCLFKIKIYEGKMSKAFPNGRRRGRVPNYPFDSESNPPGSLLSTVSEDSITTS